MKYFTILAAMWFSLNSAEAGPTIGAARDLKHLCPGELDELFAQGSVPTCPVGCAKGKVLLVLDAPSPRTRAKLVSTVWKGKVFYADGQFTNRWLGFKAVESQVAVGPSWLDGKSCLFLEYPPGSAVFGNTRDELREICPGVLLGRFYERCPCGRHRGYFVLEMEGCCK